MSINTRRGRETNADSGSGSGSDSGSGSGSGSGSVIAHVAVATARVVCFQSCYCDNSPGCCMAGFLYATAGRESLFSTSQLHTPCSLGMDFDSRDCPEPRRSRIHHELNFLSSQLLTAMEFLS